jgi:glycosidase
MKKNINLFLSVMLLSSLILTGCGQGGKPSSSNGNSGGGNGSVPSHTQSEVEQYMDGLKKSSEANHLYIHYYRFNKSSAEFSNWDVWAWPYKPKEGEGYRFDWTGRQPTASNLTSTGTAQLDAFDYATVDIDLTKDYDGGWDSVKKQMGGKPMNFYADAEKTTFDSQIGIQIVQTDSRTSQSGFWKNDGGNLYITLENHALLNEDNTTSYHVFLTQDYVQKPASRPASDNQYTDPFASDNGTNVTYGDQKYNNVSWNNKPLQQTSPAFLNGQGEGNVLPNGAGVGYQIMVASFSDSDGDGFGDIYGIEQKLDYIQNLGVNVLWLTPVQMSDSYHGYDISDYLKVDPKYGSKTSPAAVQNGGVVTADTAKADYKSLIEAAHSRGMAVVMDLVINHTSTSNNWFIDSAQLKADLRGYYQWGNHETQSSSISETKFWYPYGSHVYSYYAKFGSSMPELNYAYSDTRAAVSAVALNWLEFGVDGFRMDAVKHIFLDEEVTRDSGDTVVLDISTNAATGKQQDYSSNLTKNLNFWRDLNATVKANYPNAFFVGENFDGHAYHVAPYYEGFDSLFDFYSYFNLTSVASSAYRNGNTGSYTAWLASFLGAYDSSSNDAYTASGDSNLAGAKKMSYGGNWNLKSVMDVYNQYRTGGQKSNTSNGYSMIGGQFTSNHDIARAINRIAGSTYSSSGLEAQGEVTTTDYKTLDSLATLYEITELMLPGCTWIYYGDELGMTGNLEGKKSTDGYADLVYRQPMKWKQDGAAGDGSNTCGYSISGSGANVKWDNINKTSTVADAVTQTADSNSHYNAIANFAKIKSQAPALIKGAYDVVAIEAGAQTGQYGVKITRTLGSEKYTFYVNFSNSTLQTYDNSVVSSVPARSAILVKNNTVVAQYNGTTGTSTGGGDVGGGSGSVDVSGSYSINSLPTWITNDGCVIYAWVWGGSYGNGQWVPCTFTGTTSLTIDLDGTASGMLLVRCASGTTTPNWSIKTDTAGRIYNQTNDITLVRGQTSYSCSAWKGYNPQ